MPRFVRAELKEATNLQVSEMVVPTKCSKFEDLSSETMQFQAWRLDTPNQ